QDREVRRSGAVSVSFPVLIPQRNDGPASGDVLGLVHLSARGR
ncbi:MAG: hypothetical protein AVDCRST_MAG72-210, partial [uncultured Nocardioidaceae bacterium]